LAKETRNWESAGIGRQAGRGQRKELGPDIQRAVTGEVDGD